jgi:hypothetical protein
MLKATVILILFELINRLMPKIIEIRKEEEKARAKMELMDIMTQPRFTRSFRDPSFRTTN